MQYAVVSYGGEVPRSRLCKAADPKHWLVFNLLVVVVYLGSGLCVATAGTAHRYQSFAGLRHW